MEPHAREVPLAVRFPLVAHPRRRLVSAALVGWLALLLLATVTPGDPSTRSGPFVCFPCGDVGSADAILNIALFVPAGLLFGALGVGFPGVALAGFGTSATIEAIQFFLPGRFPTAADVVFNGLGAMLGLFLVRGRFAVLGRAWSVVAATGSVIVASAVLAYPAPPPGSLFGQHTPALGGYAPYDGRVLEARVGDLAVPTWEVADADALRRELAEGRVEVHFERGTAPDRWSPVFAVFSGTQEEALFVAVRGDDVSVRFRSLASAFRFRRPAALLDDGMAGGSPGEDMVLSSWLEGDGRCIATPVRTACGRGVGPAQGWRFLVDGDAWPSWVRLLVSMIWVSVPVALLAGARDSRRVRLLGGVVLLSLAAMVPTLGGTAAIRWDALVGGLGLGALQALGWSRWRGLARRTSRSP